MRIRTAIVAVLLLFVGVSVLYFAWNELRPRMNSQPAEDPRSEGTAAGDPAVARPAGKQVIAYYFHGNRRCVTCRTIEAYAEEAIATGFKKEIGNGSLIWLVINTDEPENAHFVQDYQLTTKSVVLVELKDGRQQKWENLPRVWQLVRNKEAFIEYIQTETKDFLREG